MAPLLLATACSDDDAADSSDAQTDPAEPSAATAADAPSTTADDGSDAFCAEFEPLNAEADDIFPTSGAPDVDELRDLVGRLAALEPPKTIAADYRSQLEAFTLLADALDGDNDAEMELDERFDEFEAASERLEPYIRDVCGLEFGN